jgi:small-conductance mechanosensitive channel
MTTPSPLSLQALDWSRIQEEMATARGWLQLAIIVAALGLAWAIDRQAWIVHAKRKSAGRELSPASAHLRGSVVRLVLPLTAWIIVSLARLLMRRHGTTLFLDIALPLLLALVVIRTIVYGLRRLFPDASWLTASERTMAFGVWALVVLHFSGLLPELVDALDGVTLPLGKEGVSLLSFLEGALVVVVTLIVTLWVSGFAEQRLMKAHFDINLRVVLSKFTRALLLAVGTLLALQWVGFDLTVLSVFGGALGVGIGLGLQRLAANYVSGFAILFDRSVRMGDRITVGDRTGIVTALTARYVVVRDLDASEAIVPNEMLVTTTVVRFPPYGEARANIPLPVAPGTDIDKALAIIDKTARDDPRVGSRTNKPRAFVRNISASGINLELAVWLQNADVMRVDGDFIVGDIARAAVAALRAAGIQQVQPMIALQGGGPTASAGQLSAAPDRPPGA